MTKTCRELDLLKDSYELEPGSWPSNVDANGDQQEEMGGNGAVWMVVFVVAAAILSFFFFMYSTSSHRG